MLLVYDVGNTNIVVGLWNDSRLVGRWRFSTHPHGTADELRFDARNALDDADASPAEIDGVCVACVVPALRRPLEAALRNLTDAPLLWIDAGTSPMRLDVSEPWAVGADRIVDCVAAYAQYGGPLLVIDFGTAATFNLVSREGNFLGGAIAPEMAVAGEALVSRAAQLFSVRLDPPATVVGKTTAANLEAGIVLGHLDLVDGLIRRFRAEADAGLRVVATGGKGELYARHLDAIEVYDPDLTLVGLRLCWEGARRKR
ncbi:MAG: type III pantothenate kinase [Candidatus Bipolaricaulota bacterium]